MIIIGLAGQANSGKNEVASYLAAHYGFVQFAFSDALYHEVQQAFGIENQDLLRDRATKDAPTLQLSMDNCSDLEFRELITCPGYMKESPQLTDEGYLNSDPLSPRQILQWWGTEYRRAQDPNYWVKRAAEFVTQMHYLPPYPELRPALFVECGTRFENEREWIKADRSYDSECGNGEWSAEWQGNIWHIHRDATDQMTDTHASAKPLPVLPGEREIFNNSSIEHLHLAVDMLLSTTNQFVRCEPMEPTEVR